nr:hypothetical protein KPHV_78460 [Kitasatospora purpeofusca]
MTPVEAPGAGASTGRRGEGEGDVVGLLRPAPQEDQPDRQQIDVRTHGGATADAAVGPQSVGTEPVGAAVVEVVAAPVVDGLLGNADDGRRGRRGEVRGGHVLSSGRQDASTSRRSSAVAARLA